MKKTSWGEQKCNSIQAQLALKIVQSRRYLGQIDDQHALLLGLEEHAVHLRNKTPANFEHAGEVQFGIICYQRACRNS